MPDFTGRSIDGRYQILEKVDTGGTGIIYRAYHNRLDCDVAIKFLNLYHFSREMKQSVLSRFEREAKEMARLTHPNIVKVIDSGTYVDGGEEIPYFVMEYMPGGSLADLMEKKRLPIREAAEMLSKIARALEYAHSQGLIHRDVKPHNILLTETGEPKLTDFGIVKVLTPVDETSIHLTSTGTTVGTPAYMPFEQWVGEAVPASDQYSLGTILYELATGRLPYGDQDTTPQGLMLKKQNLKPLPPSKLKPGLPKLVEAIILRAMAADPKKRYPNMGMMAAELERVASGAVTPIPMVVPPQVVRPAAPAGQKPAGRKRRPFSTFWLVIAAMVMLCAVLCGGTIWLVSPLFHKNTAEATATAALAQNAGSTTFPVVTEAASATLAPSPTVPAVETPTMGVGPCAIPFVFVDPKAPSYITSISMTRNANVNDYTLDNPPVSVEKYNLEEVVHAVLFIDAPKNTHFMACWYYEGTSALTQNTAVGSSAIDSEGMRYLDLMWSPTLNQQAGYYRVDVYTDGVKVKEARFKVQ